MPRKTITKKLRFEVFKRDKFVCQYCGAHPPEVVLEVDHIDPVCNGGTNSIDNLITACFNCNRGKAGNLLTAVPQSLSQKAAQIAEKEAQLREYNAIILAQMDRIEADAWNVSETLFPGSSDDGISRKWFLSIKNFCSKLPLDVVISMAETAFAAKPYSEKYRFLYFCGCCWNRIREIANGTHQNNQA